MGRREESSSISGPSYCLQQHEGPLEMQRLLA